MSGQPSDAEPVEVHKARLAAVASFWGDGLTLRQALEGAGFLLVKLTRANGLGFHRAHLGSWSRDLANAWECRCWLLGMEPSYECGWRAHPGEAEAAKRLLKEARKRLLKEARKLLKEARKP